MRQCITILYYYQVFHCRFGVLCSMNGLFMLAYVLSVVLLRLKELFTFRKLSGNYNMSVGSYVDVSSIFFCSVCPSVCLQSDNLNVHCQSAGKLPPPPCHCRGSLSVSHHSTTELRVNV